MLVVFELVFLVLRPDEPPPRFVLLRVRSKMCSSLPSFVFCTPSLSHVPMVGIEGDKSSLFLCNKSSSSSRFHKLVWLTPQIRRKETPSAQEPRPPLKTSSMPISYPFRLYLEFIVNPPGPLWVKRKACSRRWSAISPTRFLTSLWAVLALPAFSSFRTNLQGLTQLYARPLQHFGHVP